ncbi:importin-9 [Phlebotomus argentipes]|uniref:importin-9 n=1 Tax=Phlebotomus argentipes TaxID=94469 RepID=UPI0028936738|nr:importin-9 [Phlebotomus argentipes]
MFQNADKIKEAIYEELHNILNPDTSIRSSGEERLAQLKFTDGYGVYLAEIVMNQSFDLSLRQLASVMLKQYVEAHWCPDDNTQIAACDQAKKMIKNILPNGLYDSNSKIRSAVAYTISTIASYDWPTNWNELFDIIVKCLEGNDDSVHGAMQVLVEFTYDLDQQITDVGPIIISEVCRIFEADSAFSVTTRSCAVDIFKALLKAINTHIPSKQAQAEMLNPVLPKFLEKMITSLTLPNGPTSNFSMKKSILKVLCYMIRDMPRFIQPHISTILPPIWQLMTQMADMYVKISVNRSVESPFADNDDDDESSNFSSMILQLFDFIQGIIESGKFKSTIHSVLTDLIYIMVVYMQITEEQIENWTDDPENFVQDDDEEGTDFSIRVSAQDVLLILSQEYEMKVLPSLSEALSRHCVVADAEKNAGNGNWWKIHEACMLTVGNYEVLIAEQDEKGENVFNLSEYLNLVRNLMNHGVWPFLSGRCIWLMSQFSKSNVYTMQLLTEVLDTTLNYIGDDKPIVLRISAIRAVHCFCENLEGASDEKRNLLLSKLNGFVEGILALAGMGKQNLLNLILETLQAVISFDQQFTASIQAKMIPLTIAVFLKHHDDPFTLELVHDLLRTLSQNSYCLQPLQEKLIPTIVSILNLQREQAGSFTPATALEVLQTLVVNCKPPLSDSLVESAFPAMVHSILRSDDPAVIQNGGECLRAFVHVSPEQVFKYKNGEGLNYIMQVTTMLLNPTNNESTAAFAGKLVITLITKAGDFLGENIDLLLKGVISKLQLVSALSIAMSLLLTFAHLFLTQMEAVLNFLSTVPGPTGEPAMAFVFGNWLNRHADFYGTYERKVSIMALCKIFEYGVTSKDIRITSVTIKEHVKHHITSKPRTRSQTVDQWLSIPILVKIFKLIIGELVYLQEYEVAGEESDDATDDEEEDPNQSQEVQVYLSGRIFNRYEEEVEKNDPLLEELIRQEPMFQNSMEENLTKFLQNFSRDEHFREFAQHLNDDEKSTLQRYVEMTL